MPKIGPHMEIKATPELFKPDTGHVSTALRAPLTQLVKVTLEGSTEAVVLSVLDVITKAEADLNRVYRAAADAQNGFLVLVGWDSVEVRRLPMALSVRTNLEQEYKKHDFDAQFQKLQQDLPEGSKILNIIAKMSPITQS